MTDEHPVADRGPPREIWSHEALEFTPWLERNVERLGEVLDRELTVQNREHATQTGFALDLLVEDPESGQTGAVEAQLEASDHKHLGQLITYVTALEADFAVWIVHEARYEHRRAIEWVNESTDKTAYLVSLESITLRPGDESQDDDGEGDHETRACGPAPLFTLLSGPSPEARQIGEQKRERSEVRELQLRFHRGIKEQLPDSFRVFDNVRAKRRKYISASVDGLQYQFHVTNDGAYAQLYLDVGEQAENERIFDALETQREAIEDELGEPLVWRRGSGHRASRVHTELTEHGLREEDRWDDAQKRLARTMPQFYEVLHPRVRELL